MSGIIIKQGMKLAHIMEEDYYDVNVNDGLHATRMFYTVEKEGGNLLTSGNGSFTMAAKFLHFKDIEHLSDKEMKKQYREVLKEILNR